MSAKWCMMQIPHQLEGFDVEDAIARMLGRPQLWWQTLGYFVQGFADWPQRWLASQGLAADERRAVHALCSAAANVGACELADAARALERALSADAGSAPENVRLLRVQLLAAFTLAWGAAAQAWEDSGASLPQP